MLDELLLCPANPFIFVCESLIAHYKTFSNSFWKKKYFLMQPEEKKENYEKVRISNATHG